MSSRTVRYESAAEESGSSVGSCLSTIFFTLVLTFTLVGALATAVSANQPVLASPGECAVSDAYPAKVLQWCEPISRFASEAGLPPDLIAALIWQESGGNAGAYSHSGAVGLMQVMPRDGLAAAFQCRGKPCFSDRPSMSELQDPEFNLRYGTQLLKSLVKDKGGDTREALRAYGPIDVGYHYADTVLALYRQYGKR